MHSIHTSNCPVEKGVVSTRWGTLSPGQVLAAIAASLEPQSERVGKLVMANTGKEAMYKKLQELPATDTVSNIWAATLAGDLAEVVVYQGPMSSLFLGPRGEWNDSLVPRVRYLEKGNQQWDFTNSEILGGVDGLILSQKIADWVNSLQRLRVSQVLDMYYSDHGVSFDPTFQACMRKSKVNQVVNVDKLLNETINFGRVLQYNTPGSVQFSNMELLSRTAVNAFKQYLDNMMNGLMCISTSNEPPRVHLHVIMDHTWQGSEAVRLLAYLAEVADVSPFGSSLWVLGSSQQWLVNGTRSYADVMQAINSTTKWPADLNLPLYLSTMQEFLSDLSYNERRDGIIGSDGHVVLVLAYSTTLSDEEFQKTQTILETFETELRDVHLMFVASRENQARFNALVKSDNVNLNTIIEAGNSNPETVMALVGDKLRQVPGRLTGMICSTESRTKTLPGELEDYVTPGRSVTYRIHPDYLRGVDSAQLQIRGSGYGDLTACLSRTPVEAEGTACTKVTGQEVSLINVTKPCRSDDSCWPLYLTLEAKSTLSKCTEDDCRFPDQVRFTLQQKGLRCYDPIGLGLISLPQSANRVIGSLLTLVLVALACYQL